MRLGVGYDRVTERRVGKVPMGAIVRHIMHLAVPLPGSMGLKLTEDEE